MENNRIRELRKNLSLSQETLEWKTTLMIFLLIYS